MPHDRSALSKYYSEAALAKIDEKSQSWPPEKQEQSAIAWKQLWSDAERLVGEDPGNESAQALAKRWVALVEDFTGGDAEILDGLKRFYTNRPNWPPQYQEYWDQRVKPEVWDFMNRAVAIHAGRPLESFEAATGRRLDAVPAVAQSCGEHLPVITEATFDRDVIEARLPVLIVFWSPGCGACERAMPTLESIAKRYDKNMNSGRVDALAHMDLAMKLGVRSMPTAILFKGGDAVGRTSGSIDEDELARLIEPHL